ncbi:glycosyltransferase family 2 protein [Croceibacter atlanticus]|uniref:glycosyltransferase family 2 protein n=1 Tax=Croceibacter atlanticus TaxID=313588 RepID=UPI00248F7E5C|nr:glycosyltransferase [Croceibacter atlanticus]
MAKPLVSVCCITYNHAKFIEQCLDGFLMQKTSFDVEFLIHDDASPDRTQEVIKNKVGDDPRFKLILREQNIKSTGLAVSPILFNLAKGKYIAFCEGDDYWIDPLKLQKQVDFLEENPDYVLVGHKVDTLNHKGIIEKNSKTPIQSFSQKEICFNHIPTLSAVFRNVEVNFQEELQRAPSGDYILWSFLGNYGDFYLFNSSMAIYRQHQGGIWSGVSLVKKLKNSLLTREISLRYIKDKTLSNKVNKKLCISGMYRSLKYFDISSFLFFMRVYIKKVIKRS